MGVYKRMKMILKYKGLLSYEHFCILTKKLGAFGNELANQELYF